MRTNQTKRVKRKTVEYQVQRSTGLNPNSQWAVYGGCKTRKEAIRLKRYGVQMLGVLFKFRAVRITTEIL